MTLLQPRVNIKLAQRQILTPGLVQMVSVLALNKLELKEMIDQEMVENPILEEFTDQDVEATPSIEELAAAEDRAADNREGLEQDGNDPFNEIDFGAFFDEYLDPGYRTPAAEVIEKPSFENFLSTPTTLSDHLHWQLNLSAVSERLAKAAGLIIGNLSEDGFLTTSLIELAQGGEYSVEELAEALKIVQQFDPLGVGARNLRECLLIQLRGVGLANSCAYHVVSNFMPKDPADESVEAVITSVGGRELDNCEIMAFAKAHKDDHNLVLNKQYKEIAKLMNRPLADIESAMQVIRRLDPRPGLRYNKTEPRLIEPDVFFVKVGDDYQILINEDDVPQLRLNPSYRRLLDRAVSAKDVRNYIKERYSSAIQLIKNIEQRKHTIAKVCLAIIGRQQDFLDRGVDYLKPMMIKEVAEEIGVHPSTVSRAVANKYAHTPQGVYELRYFFSEAVNGPSGMNTSLLTLKRKVKKMIEDEDPSRPLTDEQIAHILQAQGISVTRRTVAKYREDMKIPSTHQRRVKH